LTLTFNFLQAYYQTGRPFHGFIPPPNSLRRGQTKNVEDLCNNRVVLGLTAAGVATREYTRILKKLASVEL
jgi:hypothetical protein